MAQACGHLMALDRMPARFASAMARLASTTVQVRSFVDSYDASTSTNTQTPTDTPWKVFIDNVTASTTEDEDGTERADLQLTGSAQALGRLLHNDELIVINGETWRVIDVQPPYFGPDVVSYTVLVRK